jgi:hypothetical protein
MTDAICPNCKKSGQDFIIDSINVSTNKNLCMMYCSNCEHYLGIIDNQKIELILSTLKESLQKIMNV